MSPILTLVLAAAVTHAEPTLEHARLIAAAIELHASIEATGTGTAAQARVDAAFWYCPERAAALASIPPVSRAPIAYSLATPVFRDLL